MTRRDAHFVNRGGGSGANLGFLVEHLREVAPQGRQLRRPRNGWPAVISVLPSDSGCGGRQARNLESSAELRNFHRLQLCRGAQLLHPGTHRARIGVNAFHLDAPQLARLPGRRLDRGFIEIDLGQWQVAVGLQQMLPFAARTGVKQRGEGPGADQLADASADAIVARQHFGRDPAPPICSEILDATGQAVLRLVQRLERDLRVASLPSALSRRTRNANPARKIIQSAES